MSMTTSPRSACQWHLIHGGPPCDRATNPFARIALCTDHRREVANSVGYGPRPPSDLERKVWEQEQQINGLLHTIQDERAERAKPRAKRPVRTDGVVYFLRVGGHIKIGWTSDLNKRMRGYHPDSTLLATKPGTRKDERSLHRKFSHLTTHGREWFPLAPQILEEVDRTVAEHGEPQPVDFSARSTARVVGRRLR